MNTTTKYSQHAFNNYAFLYYSGSNALNISNDSDDVSSEVVAAAEDYSNTNLLGLPKDFKLNGGY